MGSKKKGVQEMERLMLYTTGCPKCRILEKKLDDKGVEYDKCEDKEVMKSLGIVSVPVLKLDDGSMLGYFEAVKYVNAL